MAEALASGPAAAAGWYTSLVRSLGGSFQSFFPPARRTARLQAQYERVRLQLRQAEVAVTQAETVEARRSMRLRQAEKRVHVLQRKLDVLDQSIKRVGFRRELYFAGLDVTPDEIHTTAMAVFLVSFLAIFAVLVVQLVLAVTAAGQIALDPILATLTIAALALLPLVLYLYIYNYPQWTAGRLRVQTLGRAPEAVHYMVMSMRLNPSLDRAVRFAAENVEDPLSSSLRKVLWDVHTRNHPSIEQSFMSFAEEWGHWNEDFKNAMYSIRMATLERTDEGLAKNLEKALESVLQGTKKKIDSFAAGLQSPTTVLFGLGVLLPMIIGAMLPMIFLAGLGNTLANPGSVSSGTSSGNPLQTTPLSVSDQITANVLFAIMLDVAFPVGAFAYASSILAKRPGTLKPPEPPEVEEIGTFSTNLALSVLIGLAIGAVAYPAFVGWMGSLVQPVFELFPVFGFAVAVSVFFLLDVWPRFQARKAMERLEAEFPDALFQVGNRMAEGLPLERALDRTAEAMTGTETALFFRRILHAMRVTGQTPEQVIFGGPHGPGLLKIYPSRMVAVSMRALLEAVTKGPEAVGHTIVPMAQYLKELRDVDQSLRTTLKPTVSMMNGTAFFFSPLVLGMTGALYVLLSNVLAGGSLVVSVPVFMLVIGVYLVEMVMVIIFFSIGVDRGGDRTSLRMMIGTWLGVAVGIFLVAATLGLAVVTSAGV
ncbi:MAG: hypothetical protein KGJ69_00115 [Thermoplasmata archaeon]|nr:hypothetical protein [Thermoplasmata archaeon]